VAEKIAYSTTEGAQALGIGRTHMFELLRRGEIASVKSGRRRLIPATALDDYLARLVDDQQATGGKAAS
jgi:excisionase family DNA binding protein